MINNRIVTAAALAKRDPREIKLIGASKQQSADHLHQFHQAGLTNFGENYLQEALTKQTELTKDPINWHFIGKPQSNKCKIIAQNFDWIHSVDRLKIASRLAEHRSRESNSSLNLLIQLNVDLEVSKNGVSLNKAPSLSSQIYDLDGISLRGYMLIPSPSKSSEEQRRPFALAREVLEKTNQRYGFQLDTLSMGMSNDLEAAILEGATMLRVGTALFGSRTWVI